MDVYYEDIFEEEKMKIYANGKCHNVRIFRKSFLQQETFSIKL